jgi:fructose 1,6-bisphosphate aldolase/phosphatase
MPSPCNGGFALEVHDLIEHRRIRFECPEDLYDLLVYIGTPGRFVIRHVFRRDQPVASTSTSRLSLIAGRHVGADGPIMIVRAERAPGDRRGSRAVREPAPGRGPDAGIAQRPPHALRARRQPSRPLRRPPRVVGMGFQLADGRLIGPRDMLGDVSFDRARGQALEMAD